VGIDFRPEPLRISPQKHGPHIDPIGCEAQLIEHCQALFSRPPADRYQHCGGTYQEPSGLTLQSRAAKAIL
jgi:hypothetical protein